MAQTLSTRRVFVNRRRDRTGTFYVLAFRGRDWPKFHVERVEVLHPRLPGRPRRRTVQWELSRHDGPYEDLVELGRFRTLREAITHVDETED
jgi:hypothetical protein